jgi:hypothetical protein
MQETGGFVRSAPFHATLDESETLLGGKLHHGIHETRSFLV